MSTLELRNISLTQGPEDVIYDLSATFNSGINLLIGPVLCKLSISRAGDAGQGGGGEEEDEG
ncbi:MAG: hypothetical protein WCO24_05775, partial [Actinomycetes bacterium]